VEVRVEKDEVLVRGANVMRGYHRNPSATAEALVDGWLRTGDRGAIDADGNLTITGRLKEAMVTAAGETIYPEEAEAFYRSPLFAEAAVAALPGDDGNDLPVLFVMADPVVTDEELEDAFRSMRASAPARLRLTRLVRRSTPLPRTATGKVKRHLLTNGRDG
jgi:rifamycin polyketide synthase module 1/2/3